MQRTSCGKKSNTSVELNIGTSCTKKRYGETWVEEGCGGIQLKPNHKGPPTPILVRPAQARLAPFRAPRRAGSDLNPVQRTPAPARTRPSSFSIPRAVPTRPTFEFPEPKGSGIHPRAPGGRDASPAGPEAPRSDGSASGPGPRAGRHGGRDANFEGEGEGVCVLRSVRTRCGGATRARKPGGLRARRQDSGRACAVVVELPYLDAKEGRT
ncbi:hypothetical protein DENSPDRAFT_365841 [Dentipellis sp. KUC8613]|nr:hypothetical protein DENSPDRAFT_365841 [Dentipellis sp. KUC8613]